MEQFLDSVIVQNKINNSSKQVDLSKAPGGFITYKADGSGELIAVDKSIANIFGYDTVEEFREGVGNSFIGMIHPEDRERIEREIWKQINSTEWKMEMENNISRYFCWM